MQENYLAKWLSGELSEAELQEFKDSGEFASYQKLMEVSGSLTGPDFDVEETLNRFHKDTTYPETKVIALNPFKKFLQIAAVIAFLIAGSYFYLNSLNESVSTEFAQQTEVILPDNSEIFLNADSQISYSEKDWDEQRNVNLKGEAFFKVAKGKKFTVTTDLGEIAVLGTQFNVESRKSFFEVTCYEGLVSVSYNGKQTKLPAGNSLVVLNGKPLNASEPQDTEPSWMHNESSFENIPLQYVLDELERQFNLQVTTKEVDVNQRFTGTFSNKNLDMALKSISSPSKLRYTLEGNNVLFYAEDTP